MPFHEPSEDQTVENTLLNVYWPLAFVRTGEMCRFKKNLICKFTYSLNSFLKHYFLLFNLHKILQGFPIVHTATTGI